MTVAMQIEAITEDASDLSEEGVEATADIMDKIASVDSTDVQVS